ncbi:MAG: carbonic anhydrase family protein [Methylococcaceae bacterium]|nr:carbonic anhydrase family protein [Methylococcaceae bacterium]
MEITFYGIKFAFGFRIINCLKKRGAINVLVGGVIKLSNFLDMKNIKIAQKTFMLSLFVATVAGCNPSQVNNTQNEPVLVSPEREPVYSLPSLDPGKQQSPINIFTENAKEDLSSHEFVIHFKDEISAVENLGHTIQLDFARGSSITFRDITYNFRQIHFHTPAEHLIDGITYPMELHIVCSTEDKVSPSYLVIAILFKMGKENKFISHFINDVPREHEITNVNRGVVKLADFLKLHSSKELGHYFHYQGSLTTPPYTEKVNWVILKTIYQASREQVEAINKLEGNNARHIHTDSNIQVDDD